MIISYITTFFIRYLEQCQLVIWGRHDRMVVGFTITYGWIYYYLCNKCLSPHTDNVVSLNPTHGEVYSIQHYVIKFVSDLQQVGGFLRVIIHGLYI